MADTHLKPLTPLGHAAPQSVTIGPVTIAEVVDVAMVSLGARRGGAEAVAKVALKAGIPLPGPGQSGQAAPYASFWMGPDLWMIEAPLAEHEDMAARMSATFGEAASVTEQTDAWARFAVTGSDLPRLFERLCNADFRRAAPGNAIRSVIEHIGVFALIRDASRIEVLCARSSAGSLHHALCATARSVF